MMKKLTFALVSAFVLFAFASCNKENDLVSAAKISVDPTTLTFGVSGGATPVYLTANRDWTASVSGTGVTVSPESGSASNDPQTITINAEKNDGKTRTAVVTFSCGNNLEATVNVTVTGALGNQISVDDIYSATQGTEVETSGLVVGISEKSFVLSDETGYILVYRGEDATEAGAAIGDQVTLKGKVGKYGEMVQIVEPITITKTATGQDVEYPDTPTVINADNISTFDISKSSYIQMTGTYNASGEHHNIVIEGTQVQGSISYPVDDLGLSDLQGHNITVKGFFAGGNNSSFRNILVVDVDDLGEASIDAKTVQEVIDTPSGLVKTSGTVMAICEQGYIIADNTAAIFVYKGSKWEPNVKIGNKVSVSGTRAEHNRGPQISSPTDEITDASTATPDYGTPVDLTAPESFSNYQFSKSEYVEYTGTLTSGKYVSVDDATMQGAFYHCVDDYSALNGKVVTVRGYIVSYYESDNNYPDAWNTIVVSVEAEPYVSAGNVTVDASATSATVQVSSNTSWTVTKSSDSASDWATLGSSTGSNNGSFEVTFSANEGTETRVAEFTVSAENATPVTVTVTQLGTGEKFYVKVTEDLDDWSGSYLIICETATNQSGPQVFTGEISTTSTTYGLRADVTISDSKVSYDASVAAYEVTIAKDGEVYTIRSAAGYLGWTSGNSLCANDTSASDNYKWTVSVDGIRNAADNNRNLQYNNNKNQARFACYTSTQAAISLYKLSE